jgi:hypothetical protein
MTRNSRQDIRTAREEMRGIREHRQMPIGQFEIREVPNGAGGTNLRFEGYASVTCASEHDLAHTYDMADLIGDYTEGILRGAFSKTLRGGADVAFLVNHSGVSMARTKAGSLELSEDDTGLHTRALLNPERSDVQILRAAVEDGAIDEMSFAFRVMRQKWSYAEDNAAGIDRRWIQEVNLDKGDVCPCNYGANEHTSGLVSLRNRTLGVPNQTPGARGRETRKGKTISAASAAKLQPIHDYLAQAPTHADSLADLLAIDASASQANQLILPDHSQRASCDLAGMKR